MRQSVRGRKCSPGGVVPLLIMERRQGGEGSKPQLPPTKPNNYATTIKAGVHFAVNPLVLLISYRGRGLIVVQNPPSGNRQQTVTCEDLYEEEH